MTFAIVAWCVCAAASASAECAAVRRVYEGPPQLVPETWTGGRDLKLCPSVQTCCTHAMEDQYEKDGKEDLKNMLQGAGSHLKTFISTSAIKFRDTFLEMVQVAANSTTALFSDVYQPLDARAPLDHLFADLLAFLSGRDVDVEERVAAFFDALFPAAYRHLVSAGVSSDCLRVARPEVRPFGDLAERISSHVSRSFSSARMFVDALQLGVEVLNSSERLDMGPGCSAAFVRMAYCPRCQGIVRPSCLGLCLNVARGCLVGVSELDEPWSEYVTALERLAANMVGVNNIERVLATLDTRISETVSYLMVNSAEVTKRVQAKCGVPRRVSRQTATPKERFSVRPFPETSLYLLLQHFVRKLAESKDFYANLADQLCTNRSTVGDSDCWNGQTFSEYTKTVAGIGIPAQKYNPEMKPPKIRDSTVDMLADKLKHVKQQLLSVSPQSDSSVEGSGAWDDEDASGDLHKEPVGELEPSVSSSATIRPWWVMLCGTLLLSRRNFL